MMRCLNTERSMVEGEREREIKNAVTVVILVPPRPAALPAPVWHNRVRNSDESKSPYP
jgi:hypothetical protein